MRPPLPANLKKIALGIRLSPAIRAEVKKVARATKKSFSAAAETLIDEALRARKAA